MNDSIDKKALFNYLLEHGNPVVETDMLREFFPESKEVLSGGVSLKMFRYHFYLFHQLYTLEQELLDSDYLLCIKHIWIYLHKKPPRGRCRYFHENSVSFCSQPVVSGSVFCRFHLRKQQKLRGAGVVGSQHIRAFYLDKSNIDTITEENLKKMRRGLFEYLCDYKEIEEALRKMGLNRDFSLERLRSRYRYLSKKYHPDTHNGDERKFKEITRSYTLLLNFKKTLEEND